jgi:hypothetical protein
MFRHTRRHGFVKLLGIAAIFLLFSGLAMLLWNAVMPNIIGANSISYLQAAGLLALCRILFGGMALGGFRGIRGKGMREQLRNMRPEQREAFARRMRAGFSPRDWHDAFHNWYDREGQPPCQEKSPENNEGTSRSRE